MSNFIVSAKHAVNVLNEAHKLDPNAIRNLLTLSVWVNEDLANHPTIQVWSSDEKSTSLMYTNAKTLNLTGLLNGIFGVDENGQGPIARKYTESGDFDGFCINTNLAADARPARFCQRCDRQIQSEVFIHENIVFCSPVCRDGFKINA